MDNAIYAGLTRQSGLLAEMRVVANNIANANTTGFRREGVIFAEHLSAVDGRGDTLSMAHARGRLLDLEQGALTQTGNNLDLAIEGDGFFMIETPEGLRLTRAGAFTPSAEGELMTSDGHRLMDEGQAPIILPAGAANVVVGADGTLSSNGLPFGRIGTFAAPDPQDLTRQGGTSFAFTGNPEPAEDARIRQGFLEESNVDPVFEITRMIEVQRAYELGQSLLDREDQRIRGAITAMTR
ncbi:flagellar hook-basal body complex protein [Paracoccus sp. 1_MG-2023]|uniref:flagellar hook-basal body complex protein n=1 Tax=unclassified Paracoccus (in: a-proteobacteria) TaxID=2688777 RepID=UPI001C0A65C5|nr:MULTISPECIES: flagellar hook-basal body complex protein [unclassified Paracoccus (in: a-proteobacteria)]MBU2956890.1 flagellar hook-basal body complex protein [Paracoccus sp. C2R09]MDO6668088.1 flagellar hook-basal body complex protein [Paracoccus sp. 1_MG-2023]